MAVVSSDTGPYDPINLRFRKAYIRERLVSLRQERETLIAERDEIERKLQNLKAGKPMSLAESVTASFSAHF